MPTDTERLTQIGQRQVETNSLLIEVMKDNQTTMAERLVDLEAWLKEPPKSDLPDLLRKLTTAVEGVGAQMVELPASVARAVVNGGIGRG
jgi:hypothetical protein